MVEFDKEQLTNYMQAGKINSQALDLGAHLIKKESSMIEVLDKIEAFIKSKGAIPAFPAQISLNNIAAHFCPVHEDLIMIDGDVVKLDVGVSVNGFIADSARTFDLGQNKELVLASKMALKNALEVVRPNVPIGDIGKAIHETISSYGFTPIKNLSGHGLGKFQIHCSPSIPNVITGLKTPLKEGQVIAIEPFATTGAGIVYEAGAPSVFSLVSEKPLRNQIARKMMQDLKEYNGLPFTSRWLIPKYGVAATQIALKEMMSNGSVYAHPPLLEKGRGIVSQWEHSVIVLEKPIVYTKHDD
ncbi:MAG: type II methionyl aminopeptidase [Candidatus Woesearchaeota archaeon]|jgi:methionyl aminopeptidase